MPFQPDPRVTSAPCGSRGIRVAWPRRRPTRCGRALRRWALLRLGSEADALGRVGRGCFPGPRTSFGGQFRKPCFVPWAWGGLSGHFLAGGWWEDWQFGRKRSGGGWAGIWQSEQDVRTTGNQREPHNLCNKKQHGKNVRSSWVRIRSTNSKLIHTTFWSRPGSRTWRSSPPSWAKGGAVARPARWLSELAGCGTTSKGIVAKWFFLGDHTAVGRQLPFGYGSKFNRQDLGMADIGSISFIPFWVAILTSHFDQPFWQNPILTTKRTPNEKDKAGLSLTRSLEGLGWVSFWLIDDSALPSKSHLAAPEEILLAVTGRCQSSRGSGIREKKDVCKIPFGFP